MSKALITESTLTAIADAIRAKGGTSAALTPAQMSAAITAIPSGGGGDEPFPPGGANPAFIETHSEIITLGDTDFSDMTMTTSQQTIKAAVSSAYVSSYFPYQTSDIVIVQQAFAHHVYDGADGKAQMDNTYRVHFTYISRAKSSATGQSTRTGTLTFYYLDYLNASGVATYASGTYGIYGSCSSCSTSTSGSNMRVTIASPTWYGRSSSTYCKTANITKLNTTETKLYWIVDIFSADHFSTPLGWFVGDQMFKAFDAGSIGSLGGQS